MFAILSELVSAVACTGAFLSIAWLQIHKGTLKSPHGLFSIITFAFAGWHFITTCVSPLVFSLHEMLTGLFIISAVSMNIFSASYQRVSLVMNRRASNSHNIKQHNRRTPVLLKTKLKTNSQR